jgi:hypothetical protein
MEKKGKSSRVMERLQVPLSSLLRRHSPNRNIATKTTAKSHFSTTTGTETTSGKEQIQQDQSDLVDEPAFQEIGSLDLGPSNAEIDADNGGCSGEASPLVGSFEKYADNSDHAPLEETQILESAKAGTKAGRTVLHGKLAQLSCMRQAMELLEQSDGADPFKIFEIFENVNSYDQLDRVLERVNRGLEFSNISQLKVSTFSARVKSFLPNISAAKAITLSIAHLDPHGAAPLICAGVFFAIEAGELVLLNVRRTNVNSLSYLN